MSACFVEYLNLSEYVWIKGSRNKPVKAYLHMLGMFNDRLKKLVQACLHDRLKK